jgi:hypothetical protein
LGPSACALVGDQVLARQNPDDADGIDRHVRASLPSAREADGGDLGEDVDLQGRPPEDPERPGRRDVLRAGSVSAEPELDQRGVQPSAIRPRRIHEEIEIFGEPRLTVRCDRVTSHDQEPDPMVDQRDEQLVPVAMERECLHTSSP